MSGSLSPGSSTAVTGTAGTLVSGAPLVTFTDGASPLPAKEYAASIDWGDGTPLSGGTISVSGTTFTVAGSHNFAQPSSAQPAGVYTVTVLIVGDGQQVSTTTTATVGGLTFIIPGTAQNSAPGHVTPPGSAAPMQAVAGSPTPGIGFGGFDAETTIDPTAYSAMVDWGDGSTSTAATIDVADSGALIASTSGHTYDAAGNYTVQIVVRDAQGFVVGTGSEPIYVSNPTITLAPSLTATAGRAVGPMTLATLWTSLNNSFDGAYYSAVVDYGDGSTPVQAAITTLSGNSADVTTSGHAYAQAGTYALTLTIRDAQGVVVGLVQPTIAVADPGSDGGGPPSNVAGLSVQSATFNRRTATAVITYQGGLVGTKLAAISKAALYHLAAEPSSRPGHGRAAIRPTRITVTPGASGTSTEVVQVIFDRGQPLRSGRYLLTVKGTVEAAVGKATRIDFAQIVE